MIDSGADDASPACPCGSGRGYAECCGPLHSGAPAVTALDLMRSRFSAFALGMPDYLLETWHPSTAPTTIDLDDDTHWRRLQIVDTGQGRATDLTGIVEFRASFRRGGTTGLVHERSRFERDGGTVEGRWRYLDGDVL